MTGVGRAVAFVTDHQRHLWLLALVAYGVGDTVTTALGLGTASAAEAGPVAGPVIGALGIEGLVGIKVAFFGCFYGLWTVLRTPGRVAIPLAIATAGVFVTAWNGLVLLL